MFSPVSCANFSLICRDGFGVAANADFSVSNCFALMVVRGPLRFPFAPSSSSLPFDVVFLSSLSSEIGDDSELETKKTLIRKQS